MKFIMTFDWTPDAKKRAEGIDRFRKTGGQPPQGAKLLGRWTRADLSGGYDLLEAEDPQTLAAFAYMWNDLMHIRADLSGGYDLLEAEDPQTLAAFAYMWNDLMHITIVPVLEDGALIEALKRAGA